MVNDTQKYIVFNGKKSSDFGVWASGSQIFETPAKRVERISVPGRNGDLVIEDGSFENVELTFKDCFIPNNFAENFSNFKSFLNRQKGYQRLELSWLPDEYRLATFADSISPTIKNWDGRGKFDITFNCKPQRFLKSGEEPIYMMPPIPSGSTELDSTVYTYPSDLPADYKTISVMLETQQTGVSAKIRYFTDYDSDQTDYFESASEDLPSGEQIDFNLGESGIKHWQVRITIPADSDLDEMIFRIQAPVVIGGETIKMDARMARSVKITNPTGFRCKPLFRVYGSVFPLQDVIIGESEMWTINTNDYSSVATDVYIDCENEYFYYLDENNKKKNITGYMTISHTEYNGGSLPVSFPELGEDETTMYMYLTYPYKDSLVAMYPHWFTI
jgi:phage-related protein